MATEKIDREGLKRGILRNMNKAESVFCVINDGKGVHTVFVGSDHSLIQALLVALTKEPIKRLVKTTLAISDEHEQEILKAITEAT